VSVPDFVSTATALGLLSNLDRVFDHTGKGSSSVSFTISGRTDSGAPFTLARSNRFASRGDASYESIFEPAAAVDALMENDFTGVTLDQVRISATLSDQVRAFHVARVQVRVKGAWRTVGPQSVVRVRHGRRIFLRVVLGSRRNELGTKVVAAHLRVPRAAPRGVLGFVQVGSDLGLEDEGGLDTAGAEPASFAQLVRSLQDAPRNDELPLSLQLLSDDEAAPSVRTKSQVGAVVSGSAQFMVRIR
jgi:hypothetical protein